MYTQQGVRTYMKKKVPTDIQQESAYAHRRRNFVRTHRKRKGLKGWQRNYIRVSLFLLACHRRNKFFHLRQITLKAFGVDATVENNATSECRIIRKLSKTLL